MPSPAHTLLALVATGTAVIAQAGADLDPFLRAHCWQCHGGDSVKGKLDLSAPPAGAAERWWLQARLRDRAQSGEMPPPGSDRPSATEVATFVAATTARLQREVPKLPPDPGRVTVRRLSRAQWENAMRDLFGVAITTTAFPEDSRSWSADSGFGRDK